MTKPQGEIRHVQSGMLSPETAQTSGMVRSEAISQRTGSERMWMGESRMDPGSRSGNHHHGDSETCIYVLSGHPVFVFARGNQESRIETAPGDYVFVPPFVPHREENPSLDEEAVVILSRSTQEAVVVNLPRLTMP